MGSPIVAASSASVMPGAMAEDSPPTHSSRTVGGWVRCALVAAAALGGQAAQRPAAASASTAGARPTAARHPLPGLARMTEQAVAPAVADERTRGR